MRLLRRFTPRSDNFWHSATAPLDELLDEYPELSEVIVDGAGITTRRPKCRQAKNYSWKSKKHEKKIVLAVNRKDGLILSRTKLRSGSVHDKRILEEDSSMPHWKKILI